MKKGFLLLILIISCSSCASIFNGRRSKIQIHTNKNVQLVVEGDTINRQSNDPVILDVKNNKHPLPIVVVDSARQEFLAVASHKPGTYWMNIISPWFSGFLVDEISGLKWRYPRKIYIESTDQDISFTPYLPMDSTLLLTRNKISFTPFQLINGYHPAWEVGYERMHSDNRATQFSLGVFRSWDNDYARNSKGFLAGIEHKIFLRSQERTRWYASLNLEHLRKDHDAFLRFVVTDAQGNTNFPWVDFIRLTTVEKRFITLTPRIGFQHYVTNRLVVDAFFGIGLRYRSVKHQQSTPMTRHIDDFDWIFIDAEFASNREASNFRPNFDLNLRLAWTF